MALGTAGIIVFSIFLGAIVIIIVCFLPAFMGGSSHTSGNKAHTRAENPTREKE